MSQLTSADLRALRKLEQFKRQAWEVRATHRMSETEHCLAVALSQSVAMIMPIISHSCQAEGGAIVRQPDRPGIRDPQGLEADIAK